MTRKTGREAEARAVSADSVDDLDEISSWLGTYKERLRQAHRRDRGQMAIDVRRWGDRLNQRRAELA